MAKFSPDEREKLAKSVTSVDVDSDEAFFSRLQQVLADPPPAVYVEYGQLKVVRHATTSALSLPSLPNVFLKIAKVSYLEILVLTGPLPFPAHNAQYLEHRWRWHAALPEQHHHFNAAWILHGRRN